MSWVRKLRHVDRAKGIATGTCRWAVCDQEAVGNGRDSEGNKVTASDGRGDGWVRRHRKLGKEIGAYGRQKRRLLTGQRLHETILETTGREQESTFEEFTNWPDETTCAGRQGEHKTSRLQIRS